MLPELAGLGHTSSRQHTGGKRERVGSMSGELWNSQQALLRYAFT